MAFDDLQAAQPFITISYQYPSIAQLILTIASPSQPLAPQVRLLVGLPLTREELTEFSCEELEPLVDAVQDGDLATYSCALVAFD